VVRSCRSVSYYCPVSSLRFPSPIPLIIFLDASKDDILCYLSQKAYQVRCDACHRCIRTGQLCPGLPDGDGPFFVDMTGIAKHGMRKRKPKQSAKSMESMTPTWLRPDDVTILRISQRAVVTEAFYERFLTHFTSEGEGKDIRNRRTWLHHLPVLSTDGTNEALVSALQAVISAYCAVESADPALTRHSWNLYGEAFRMHSRFVSRSRSKYEVTVHMVSTSVLFRFFEAMQATNADAYRSHVYGAAKMLEVTVPGQCTQGEVFCV
jgi:hypothetical protein